MLRNFSSVLALLIVSYAYGENRVVALCNVFERPQDFNKQNVIMKGVIINRREASEFADPSCKAGPQVNGYTFRPGLSIRFVMAKSNGVLQAYNKAVEKTFISKKAFEVKANVEITGVLSTSSSLNAVRTLGPNWVTNGFGHLNMFPAEIAIKKINSFTILTENP